MSDEEMPSIQPSEFPHVTLGSRRPTAFNLSLNTVNAFDNMFRNDSLVSSVDIASNHETGGECKRLSVSSASVIVGEDNQRLVSTCVAGSSLLTLINGMDSMGVPYVVVSCGWVSFLIVVLLGCLSHFTAGLLGECLYDKLPAQTNNCQRCIYNTTKVSCEHRRHKYHTIASIAYDILPYKLGGIVVAAEVVEMFGYVILYIITLGDTMHGLSKVILEEPISKIVCMAIFSYLSIPILMVSSMRIISIFSSLAVICLTISVASMFVGSCLQIGYHGIETDFITSVRTPNQIPVGIGLILLTFSAHPVLPGIEAGMAEPYKYFCMLTSTYSISIFYKIVFGTVCALAFGYATNESMTNTFSNPPALFIIVNSSMAIFAFFNFPLVFYVISRKMDRAVLSCSVGQICDPNRSCTVVDVLWILFSRATVVSVGLLFSSFVPHFSTVAGLIGSISCGLLSLILPAIFHVFIFWNELAVSSRILRISISVLGAALSLTGVTCSTMELFDKLKN